MTGSAYRLSLGLLVLLCGSGCSLWQSGKELVFEDQPTVDPAVANRPLGPRTIQERYPFVRFISHPDRTITGVVTVPTGEGDKVVNQLKALCRMDDGAEPPPSADGKSAPINPKLYSQSAGGGVFSAGGIATAKWDGKPGAWVPIEDLVLITGSEVEIEEVLGALDLWYNASPQIEIQATVFDVTNSDLFERGIVQADGQPILEKVDSSTFFKALGGSFPAPSNPGFGAGKGAAGLGGVFRVGFLDSNFQMDAYLQFLKQEGVVDIVASPRVVTRNGVPALIISAETIPFLAPGGVNLGGATNYTVAYKDVGVTLNVIPFLIGSDTLHLVINAEISRLGRDVVIGLDVNSNAITVPSTSRRTATTEVIVRSGTRVVIGGMKLRERRQQTSKIPILGDIPLLGWLFSNESKDTQETTIYFVIEPTVKPVPTIEKIGDIFDPFAK